MVKFFAFGNSEANPQNAKRFVNELALQIKKLFLQLAFLGGKDQILE